MLAPIFLQQTTREGKVIAGQHTTDLHPSKPGIQSVLERNDLEEIMAMVCFV